MIFEAKETTLELLLKHEEVTETAHGKLKRMINSPDSEMRALGFMTIQEHLVNFTKRIIILPKGHTNTAYYDRLRASQEDKAVL